jgi:pimeloyl-ACP methyl ester carboxylesterase
MKRAIVTVLAFAVTACESGPTVPYVPRDPSLRHQPLLFYAAHARHPRAFVFFLGNDVGFWKPHEELAWRLAENGYDVVGLDIKQYLAGLPEQEPGRDSAFAASIGPLIDRTRAEMHADSLPLVLGGHSFGAEVAFWIALHRPSPRLMGVLALSPRGTGHLVVTPFDLMNYEASGPWSFSTIQATSEIAPNVRIALVRGVGDTFRRHDAAFIAAGGARLRYFSVPLAGHSLRKLIIAGPIIEHALDFLVERRQGSDVRTASSNTSFRFPRQLLW